MGLDFAIEFHPKIGKAPANVTGKWLMRKIRNLVEKKQSKIDGDIVITYDEYVDHQLGREFSKLTFPTVMPSWDNSSRRKTNAFILHNSTPEKYGYWLQSVIQKYPWKKDSENFLFINAWNEWAEGNHLEPCQKWGKLYLEETKKALQKLQ